MLSTKYVKENYTMATMKAVIINEYGGLDVFKYTDVPKPEVTDNTVLVKVHAAGINPVDNKTRQGSAMAGDYGDKHFPLILGWDISGVVEAVGQNVSQFKAGDEVYGMVGFPEPGSAYAEYVVTNPSMIALKPKNLSHVEASVVPLVALTSWQAMFDTAGLEAGQKILIHAAAGGVGHIAVQLAKWKGAYVIGTASGRNAEFLQSIGVDQHVDYTKVEFDEVLSDLDVVLDMLGYDMPLRSTKTIKDNGYLVSILTSGTNEDDMPDRVRWKWILVGENQAQLTQITEIIEAGQLKPTVSHVFSLEQLADAHEQIESGHTRGKIAIKIV
jgi:NADPH:quinone reductase-like Zn-dependent oxidoreductase